MITLIIFFGLLYAEDTAKVPVDENQSIEELLNNNRVAFGLSYGREYTRAYLACDKGKFECGSYDDWKAYIFQRVEYVDSELCNVYFMTSSENFDTTDYDFDKLGTGESGYSGYPHLLFPFCHRAAITKEMVLKCIRSNDDSIDIFFNIEERHPVQCQAIVIDNLRIRSKPSINSEIVGNLAKLSEITLYEESVHKDTIDNIESPWYKTKTADGKDGWVFGAYVRIFFTENKGLTHKTAILERFGNQ